MRMQTDQLQVTKKMSDITEYTRACQECGHRQIAKDPATYRDDTWRDIKCKKCHSPSLDYGSTNYWWDEDTFLFIRKARDE